MAPSLGKMPTTSVRRLTSLLRRSIAWSQYTFSARGAAERDHVANLHILAVDDYPVDEELDKGAALGKGRVLDAVGDGRPEVLDAGRHRLQVVPVNGVGVVLLSLAHDLGEAALKLATARLKFFECESLRFGTHRPTAQCAVRSALADVEGPVGAPPTRSR